MVVEALLLSRNEHSDDLLQWICSQKQTPKVLALIQNAAIYYQCLVTKRAAGTMSAKQRDEHAKTNYKGFTVPSFLCWWKTICGQTPPSWLTQELMGRTTGGDTLGKLYHTNGQLWSKYAGAARDIRRDFNHVWDSFLVDGELPSGMQAEDIWEDLQVRLWLADRQTADRKKTLLAANAAAKLNPVAVDKTGNEAEQTGTDKASEGPASGDTGGMAKAHSAAALKFAAERALLAAERRREGEGGSGVVPPGEGRDIVGDEEREDGGAPGTAAGIKLEKSDEEKQEEEEEGEELDKEALLDMYGPKPENWMHSASLVFAIFGRPAGENEDVDLNLKMNGGLTDESSTKKKRKDIDSAPPTPGGDSASPLSTKGLRLMNGAGGKQSRAQTKQVKHEVNAENKKLKAVEADAALKRKALEIMSAAPVESKSTLEMAASVVALTAAVVRKDLRDEEEVARRRWGERAAAMEKKLALLERRGKGETPEAQRLEQDLMKLYDNPVVTPLPAVAPLVGTSASATPSLARGDGEGVAGEKDTGEGLGVGMDEIVEIG